MRKKVIFFAKDLNIGGIEKSLVNLLNNLVRDYDVTLVLEKDEGALRKDLSGDVRVLEYRVSDVKCVPIRKIINYTRRLSFLRKHKGKYDFACAYATYLNSASVLSRECSVNNAIFVHNDYYNIYEKDEFIEFFDSRKVSEFRKIIFVSNNSRENFCKIKPELYSKTLVINNIIDVDEIITKSQEDIELKKGTEDIVFTFIGRLDEHQKRISRLLELFKKLVSKNDKIKLWIVGGGDEYERASKYIEDHDLENNITLLGMQKNPYKYISKSDYVIITSDYEGFPVIFNEANILNKYIFSTLDISDDYFRLEDAKGMVIPKDTDKASEIILDTIRKSVKVVKSEDFTELNEKRISKIKEVIENEI